MPISARERLAAHSIDCSRPRGGRSNGSEQAASGRNRAMRHASETSEKFKFSEISGLESLRKRQEIKT